MTQLSDARAGKLTPEMKAVAEKEKVDERWLREKIAEGRIVIPANRNHKALIPCGVGEGLLIKVNANIGTSSDKVDLGEELEKLRIAISAGADAVMDLSTGGDIDLCRRKILERSTVTIGTVPIYQAVVDAINQKGGLIHLSVDKIFEVIEKQAADGVDFITVHCGLTRAALETLKQQGRVTDIVSRGGAFLTTWMLHHDRENPLYENFDRLLEIAEVRCHPEPGGRAEARVPRGRHRSSPDPRIDDARPAHETRLGERCPGDDRRARPRPVESDARKYPPSETALPPCPILRARAHW